MHLRCDPVGLSYRPLLENYHILNLSSIRLQLDAVMYDLCHNKYDCPALICMLCYRVPYRAQQREVRPHQLFAVDRCRTVAGTRSPMRRLVEAYNKHFKAIENVALAIARNSADSTGNTTLSRRAVSAVTFPIVNKVSGGPFLSPFPLLPVYRSHSPPSNNFSSPYILFLYKTPAMRCSPVLEVRVYEGDGDHLLFGRSHARLPLDLL
ncbi:hypothetical protein EVAR_89821_1 [Eumeta japonica]|uniref:Uncharacterized protein n=1 Tax=Eumeta variegata TaxID=151549 RepID=A0A4C1YKF9_EUMVA|nr:hypothetical protein EVAR_89821_1 [Eumeta japonica]